MEMLYPGAYDLFLRKKLTHTGARAAAGAILFRYTRSRGTARRGLMTTISLAEREKGRDEIYDLRETLDFNLHK